MTSKPHTFFLAFALDLMGCDIHRIDECLGQRIEEHFYQDEEAADRELQKAKRAVASCATQIYTNESAKTSLVPAEPLKNDYITQTVYGFLDFTTTIANTVMVFSPQSAPPEKLRQPKSASVAPIETKPPEDKVNSDIHPSKTYKSDETKKEQSKIVIKPEQNIFNHSYEVNPSEAMGSTLHEVLTKNLVLSTIMVRPKSADVPGMKHNFAELEYDFLSKQPTEVVDETYKVINLRPSSKLVAAGGLKPRAISVRRDKENPTGLVTRLGGTIIKDGLTTIHETSVIGTYINGKYAQVLQSSSRLLDPPAQNLDGNDSVVIINSPKIRPSSTQRILKTLGPQQQGKLKHQQLLEPTPLIQIDDSENEPHFGFGVARPNRKQPNGLVRSKFRNKIIDETDTNESGAQQNRPFSKNRSASIIRPNYKNRTQQQGTSTTESSNGTRRRSSFRPSSVATNPNKQYKNSKPEQALLGSSVKSKLPRTQGRWSYKTTPKPRIQIRKQSEDEFRQLGPVDTQSQQQSQGVSLPSTEDLTMISSQRVKLQEGDLDIELDESESGDINVSIQQHQQQQQLDPSIAIERSLHVETINVEISTPTDFSDIYFEIATVKSPYEFQVGTSRNTRYVTVTSTFKKSFATVESSRPISSNEPLTENILVSTGGAYETSLPLDSSVATLPAIVLEPSQATPPLETITETFSTTQTLLKTHLLPVISNDNSTTRLTLVQTYNIARIVTATKTLPPSEIYQFVPSKTLNEFNSKLDEAGSELHLELDFGDDDRDDEDIPKRIVIPNIDLNSDLELFKGQPTSPKPKIDASLGKQPTSETPMNPEQIQQLALLGLLGQQHPKIITTSKPVIMLETVYEAHVIPLVNAGNTIFSTLSRAVATVPRTSYEYGTSTVSPLLPQVPQVPQVPIFPQPHPQFTVTSAPLVEQTVTTISDSRVLKLTFGAKTAYTTLFSTRVVPTERTTYVTSTIALPPTVANFPGFFPPAVGYHGYPFVG